MQNTEIPTPVLTVKIAFAKIKLLGRRKPALSISKFYFLDNTESDNV